jgi:20S proteasome alpha/beta subunit
MPERSSIVKPFFVPPKALSLPVWPSHERLPFPCIKPYILPVPYSAKERERAMTIAAGFCCSDGVVLAADTLMTLPGGGKTYRPKLFKINEKESSYLAYSGTEAFAKGLVSKLQQGTVGRSGNTFLKTVEGIYKHFWREHYTEVPKAEKTWAHVLITFRRDNKIALYRTSLHHVYPVVDSYAVLGIGEDAGEALFKPLYRAGMETYEAAYMVIYAFQKVKKYTEGCGGETQIRSISNPNRGISLVRFANFEMVPERPLQEIEGDFNLFDEVIQPALLAYPDLDGTNQKQFKGLYVQAMKRLEHARAAKYRKREREERRLRLESSKYEVARKRLGGR